jgi:hypothetical protein
MRTQSQLPPTLGKLIVATAEEQPGLPAQLAATIDLRGAKRHKQLLEQYHQAKDEADAAAARVTLMDQLHLLSETPTVRAAREARERMESLRNQLLAGQEETSRQFLQELELHHPEASLFYSSAELEQRVADLKAVCYSRKEVDSRGRRHSVYYCEIEGLQPAREAGKAYAVGIVEQYGILPGLLVWMLQSVTTSLQAGITEQE